MTRSNNFDAVSVLQDVVRAFEELDLEREAGIAQLHLAEAFSNQGAYREALVAVARALDARHAVGNGTLFALELRELPGVLELLVGQSSKSATRVFLEDWRTLEARHPQQITVITLGTYDLLINAERATLTGGRQKSIELIAYLLEVGEATLEQLCIDLYPEEIHTVAKSRLQSLRTSLHKNVPGLLIPHLKDKNVYTIEHPGWRLRYDAREVRHALENGGAAGVRRALGLYTGAFLGKSEQEWVEHKRLELEFAVSDAGVEALEDLLALERYDDCMALADRLLEVSPYNLNVCTVLIKAVARAKGVVAARTRLERIDPMIRDDLARLDEIIAELRGADTSSLN